MALLYDQKYIHKEPPPPHEHNATTRRTQQQQQSINKRKNTRLLPPPSYARLYCSPQQKSNPQAWAHLGDLCIFSERELWIRCTLACTTHGTKYGSTFLISLLQLSLPYGTKIYKKIHRMHGGLENNLNKERIQGITKLGTSELKHVPWNNVHMNALLSYTSTLQF